MRPFNWKQLDDFERVSQLLLLLFSVGYIGSKPSIYGLNTNIRMVLGQQCMTSHRALFGLKQYFNIKLVFIQQSHRHFESTSRALLQISKQLQHKVGLEPAKPSPFWVNIARSLQISKQFQHKVGLEPAKPLPAYAFFIYWSNINKKLAFNQQWT